MSCSTSEVKLGKLSMFKGGNGMGLIAHCNFVRWLRNHGPGLPALDPHITPLSTKFMSLRSAIWLGLRVGT